MVYASLRMPLRPGTFGGCLVLIALLAIRPVCRSDTNLKNGRTATIVIVGRPFVPGRIIDVSTNVADILDFRQAGEAIVQIEVVQR